jgi:large subunit ribosomal protein L19
MSTSGSCGVANSAEPTESARPRAGDYDHEPNHRRHRKRAAENRRHLLKVGDGIKVHTRVREGDKERIQIFAGIVIGRKGRGINETFTVRRISYGEGVERVFPIHSPRIAKVEVEKSGRARRAKLNYLRDRKGKEATAVRE